jgi:hypothetical protein
VGDVRLRNHRSAGGVEAGVVHRLLSSLTMWLPFDVTITVLTGRIHDRPQLNLSREDGRI